MTDRTAELLPLKPVTYSVLLVLADRPDYGYGIAKRIATPDAGAIRLAPSNLYHVLDRLQESGLIEVAPAPAEADARRTYYALSVLGRAALRAETGRLRAMLHAPTARVATGA